MGGIIFVGIGLGIFALLWWLKSIPTLDDKFRNIQSSIVGMTYEEVIEHLGPEERRDESPNSLSISYLSSARIMVIFRPNEDGNWVCVDYSYTPT